MKRTSVPKHDESDPKRGELYRNVAEMKTWKKMPAQEFPRGLAEKG